MNSTENRPTRDQPQESKPEFALPSKYETAFILLFNELPKLDEVKFADVICAVEPIKTRVTVDVQVEAKDALCASLEFDDHKLQLVGLTAPAPAGLLERTVQVSNWSQQDKTPLNKHQAHIICYYLGSSPDPGERLVALYKVAYAFYDKGILGILDEDAWNCAPRRVVKEQMTRKMLASCRATVPLGLWTGFVKLFKNKNQVWFCTKGYHRFGVNDLAYLGSLKDADFAYDVFGNLFFYVRESQMQLKIGDTAQVAENEFLRFKDVYEYHDHLKSPLGTLVIEKIRASEINRP